MGHWYVPCAYYTMIQNPTLQYWVYGMRISIATLGSKLGFRVSSPAHQALQITCLKVVDSLS